jgi:hypothetical protein
MPRGRNGPEQAGGASDCLEVCAKLGDLLLQLRLEARVGVHVGRPRVVHAVLRVLVL